MNHRSRSVALPSWVIAASAAVVVIAALAYFIAGPGDRADEAVASDTPSTTAPADPGRGGGGKDRPSASPSKDAEPTKDAPTKPRRTREPAPEPSVDVDVYNNSGITGLAADTAARVTDAGWTVTAEDNWYGNIPETTVYYPEGLKEQAELLAKELGVSRTNTAVDPMSRDRLSLILTAAL